MKDHYLGIDLSTQSASGLLIEGESGSIVWQHSVVFAKDLPGYGTENGVIPGPGGVVESPPLMWAEALEMLLAELSRSGADLSRIRAVSGSGQQHGSVYFTGDFPGRLSRALADKPLFEQISASFSRRMSPVWMDTSTAQECREIESSAGDIGSLAGLTGSAATLRFTGPQIRKFSRQDPAAYRKTRVVHLVSSFVCSLLAGKSAPIDASDGSGMNLLDLRTRLWHPALCEITAPGLEGKLPPVVPPDSIVGTVAPFWVKKYGFDPETVVVVFSGDNPCSLAGMGMGDGKIAAISLGTSDTFFGLSSELRISPEGEGNVFAGPTGGYMSLICYANGSLSREKVRSGFGLSWEDFDRIVRSTPAGNRGRIMLPYFTEEITPPSRRAQVYRFGFREDDAEASCRAVIEAQMISQRLHSRHIGRPERIHATGGASRNDTILQIMADVFGVRVHRLETQAGAGFGAALRAMQAVTGREWDDISRSCVRFDRKHFDPDPVAGGCYEEMMPLYEAIEKFALKDGKDPESQRLAFIKRWT